MSGGAGPERVEVYAIVRLDSFLTGDVPLEDRVTVKEVLPSLEEAEREVARLNALIEDGGVVYVWQYTRYFPTGRGAPAG